jgi:hydrogenase expression/formation protein HypE
MKKHLFRIRAVLFDFDGTLSKPEAIDFLQIKKSLGCPPDRPILEFIETLPTTKKRQSALSILEKYEAAAAKASVPNIGAEELVQYLNSKQIPIGIVSRNSLKSINRALENFKTIDGSDFDYIISREAPVAPKPSPEAVLLAVKRLSVAVEEVLVVGDYIFDIEAGNRAGAWTAWITNEGENQPDVPGCDFTFARLPELQRFIRMRLPCHAGKLPNDLLTQFLNQYSFEDPSVLIHPQVGEDTTAVDVTGEGTIVMKSDPITFTAENIGYYTVLINANDIATSGAVPRWFLTTLLFPLGTTPVEIRQVMEELSDVCHRWGITLCGGHTEITDAVTRPVASGMLVGTVEESRLIRKQNIKPDDQVILTKSISVEGTAIIAQTFFKQLKELGMETNEIKRCRELLSHISILEEARIAAKSPGVHAMHDVTEGGLVTAIEEFSKAGSHGIKIDMEKIPVYKRTEHVCRLLNLNPLGLIGSGSLLIICDPAHTQKLMSQIENAGIQATCIGKVLGKGSSVIALEKGQQIPWPEFEVDEITRLYENQKI